MADKTIFRGIVGSQAFGTNTASSDTDIAEIYLCDNNDILGLHYKEHDDIDKDNRCYELNKFIKLLMAGNPNMLEILNLPSECILLTTPEWDMILAHKHKFVTKALYNTFVGYATTQISKAKGLNKKINWEQHKVERKTVLDFCYVYDFLSNNTTAIPLAQWLKTNGYDHMQCGLVNIDHFRYCHLLYVDALAWVKENHNPRFSNIETHNFCGIVSNVDTSNDVCLSSVPPYCKPVGILYFNKDGYSSHCKDYNEYQEWLSKRNNVRYNTNKEHGQAYDSKNIMHMVRLLNTARDIALTGDIPVRRSKPEIEYLLKIKSGEENLEQLVEWAAIETAFLKGLYENSSLPDMVDKQFCHDLIINIRTLNARIQYGK